MINLKPIGKRYIHCLCEITAGDEDIRVFYSEDDNIKLALDVKRGQWYETSPKNKALDIIEALTSREYVLTK